MCDQYNSMKVLSFHNEVNMFSIINLLHSHCFKLNNIILAIFKIY
jgi:hypothetical protein